jgi:ABC-type multidrug transport system fused ATPase/permease subunit
LSVFLAAGTRIAPAVLRVQQGGIQIRSSLGAAAPTLDLIETIGNAPLGEDAEDTVDVVHDGFRADVEISNVSLTYPEKDSAAIHEISLYIPNGSTVAFVGPSGAGKRTRPRFGEELFSARVLTNPNSLWTPSKCSEVS